MGKNSPQAVVSGMGLGLGLLSTLVTEARRYGCTPEEIHALVTGDGHTLMADFGKQLADKAIKARNTGGHVRTDFPAPWTVEEVRTEQTGDIKFGAPLCYGNGSLVVQVSYAIEQRDGYANRCSIQMYTCYDQYAKEQDRVDPQMLVPDERIFSGIALVLEYARCVRRHLEQRKSHPPTPKEFQDMVLRGEYQPIIGIVPR